MRTADFRYDLPEELIAQTPAVRRDASRLMVLDRQARSIAHRQFLNLPEFLRSGDLLVLNNSKVIPARLRARKVLENGVRGVLSDHPPVGGSIEVFLAEELAKNDWLVLLRPGKRVRAGTKLAFQSGIEAIVADKNDEGQYRIQFTGTGDILDDAERFGEVPLPPYIAREQAPGGEDRERYQTVFAEHKGSVAAPTAGLHFTPELLERIRAQGVETAHITLHVGLGTFAPVKAESLAEHKMHSERFQISESAAEKIRAAKASGRRVIAVGTTSLRVLESAAAQRSQIEPMSGRTSLFVYPPYRFRIADALLTNFHLPESTLLMLVSAFASPEREDGRAWILQAYAEAVRERYRFFSYGDAMLIR